MLFPDSNLVARFRELLARLGPNWTFGPPLAGDDPPADPDAPVREPRRHGPGGRGSAIALDEPVEVSHDVNAVGRAVRH